MSEKIIEYHSGKYRILILSTLLIALMIDILNLISINSILLPPFSLLIILFWAGKMFDKTFIPTAFILGIFHDALFQTLMGSYALIFSFITFLLLRNRVHFRAYSIPQQSLFIFGLMIIYQTLGFFILSPTFEGDEFWYFWSMPLISIAAWIVFASILTLATSLKSSNE